MRVAVLHADRAAEAEEPAEAVRRRVPVADLPVGWIGPVMGSHVGPGALGLTWHPLLL